MIDRIEVCRNMLTLFEYDGSLKKEAIDSLHKLKEFVSKESTPYNDCLPQNYELLNNKMKEFKSLGSSKLAARTYLNTKQINEFLQDKMREYELFKLDSELVGKGITQRYQFKHIRKVDDNSLASIAGFISNRIFEITREYITDNFTKVHVGYNKEGVNLLLEKLRESNYATCNFSYANDTAFYISENRGENFDRLKETLKKVKISYDWNNPHVFMKDKLNHIFVVVDKIRIDMLDDDTTAKFLERRKVEDNTYKIDEIILNYDSAFEYIKLHYVQDFLSVSIFTTISKDSGFIVEN